MDFVCIKQVLVISSLLLEGYHFVFSSFFFLFLSILLFVKREDTLLPGKDLGTLGSRKMFLSPGPQWDFRWFEKY